MRARSYATGMQTIALFGLKLKRFTAVLGALTWFLMCVVVVLVFPARSAHTLTLIHRSRARVATARARSSSPCAQAGSAVRPLFFLACLASLRLWRPD